MSGEVDEEDKWWDSINSYLSETWPLIAIHAIFTPLGVILNDVQRGHAIVPNLQKHFVFSERALKNGRWWTLVSHMFLHESYEDLAGHMAGLVVNGVKVWSEFGPNGMAIIFFGGGILAALDRKTKIIQLYSAMDTAMRDFFLSSPRDFDAMGENFRSFVGNDVDNWFNQVGDQLEKAAGRIASRLTPYVSPYIEFMGCSAGVSALSGAGLCISAERLISYIISLVRGKNRCNGIRLIGLLGSLSFQLGSLFYEIYMQKRGGFTGIDHPEHLSGFSAGIGMYIIFKLPGMRKLRKMSET